MLIYANDYEKLPDHEKKSVIHETSDIALFEHASSNAEAKTLFFPKKVHFSKNGPFMI